MQEEIFQLAFDKSSYLSLFNNTFLTKNYTYDENVELTNKINDIFFKIIDKRDKLQIDRYKTLLDCGGMSLTIQKHLKKINIESLIVIGDISFDKHLEYGTTYDYLFNELSGKRSECLNYHVWLLVENNVIVDPTISLKETFRNSFLDKTSKGEVAYHNAWSSRDNIEYIPFLIGEKFLNIVNPCPYIFI